MGNLRLNPAQNQAQSGVSGYGSLLSVTPVETGKTRQDMPGSLMGALMGVTALNIRTNVIPSYHMRSLGRFQSFSPGLRDGGEIAAAVNWLPGLNATQGSADWSLIRQATLESNQLTKIRVLAPDPDLHLISMNGFLTQLGPISYQPEAIMSGQCGWKIVGKPEIITPIVYSVKPTRSGTFGASGATLVAGEAQITRVNGAGSSEPGSTAAGIFFGGGTNRMTASSAGITAVAAVTDSEKSLTVAIKAASLTGIDSSQDANSDLRIRCFIPGYSELWSDDIAADGDQDVEFAGTGGTQAGNSETVTTVEEFLRLLHTNTVQEFFVAIYGGAQGAL